MTRAKLSRVIYHDYNPDALSALRRAKGLTLQEVATALGVVPETVQRAERGRAASYDLVLRYCEHLGLMPETVISQDAQHEPEKRGRRRLKVAA